MIAKSVFSFIPKEEHDGKTISCIVTSEMGEKVKEIRLKYYRTLWPTVLTSTEPENLNPSGPTESTGRMELSDYLKSAGPTESTGRMQSAGRTNSHAWPMLTLSIVVPLIALFSF